MPRSRRENSGMVASAISPISSAAIEQRLQVDLRNPILSIDTKKKELLGTLYRSGRVYSQRSFHAFDHDFPSWSTGKIVPHGIWDEERKHGHLNLGLSHDTSEFACDSFRWYWKRIGRFHYPEATSILWLCDAGGSNNCRHHIFKHDLQELVNDIGVKIRVAHYPTYCSKFNPIERRFFSQVTRTCQGILFDTLETVVNLMRKTRTSTGRRTTVHVIKKLYETGRKVPSDYKTLHVSCSTTSCLAGITLRYQASRPGPVA